MIPRHRNATKAELIELLATRLTVDPTPVIDALDGLGVHVGALMRIMTDENNVPLFKGRDDRQAHPDHAGKLVKFRTPCEHCPDGHTDPRRVPFGVYLGPQRDADGQPTQLIVMRTQGSHVAQSDADWLWQLIRDYARNTELPPELQQ